MTTLFDSGFGKNNTACGYRALSLRQPWANAVLFGGKRIENRLRWTPSYPGWHFRGDCFLHAAAGMTRKEYHEVVDFCARAGIGWTPPPPDQLPFGGIIGRMRIVRGIVTPKVMDEWIAQTELGVQRGARELQRKWYMGKFALVLEEVKAVPFVPLKGALGFFKVSDEVAHRALGKAA